LGIRIQEKLGQKVH